MTISKILVLAAFAASVTATSTSAQILKHDEGRTYEDIAKCLEEEVGLTDRHFRKKPGTEGTIQFNRAALQGDGFTDRGSQQAIADCWKNPAESKKK